MLWPPQIWWTVSPACFSSKTWRGLWGPLLTLVRRWSSRPILSVLLVGFGYLSCLRAHGLAMSYTKTSLTVIEMPISYIRGQHGQTHSVLLTHVNQIPPRSAVLGPCCWRVWWFLDISIFTGRRHNVAELPKALSWWSESNSRVDGASIFR